MMVMIEVIAIASSLLLMSTATAFSVVGGGGGMSAHHCLQPWLPVVARAQFMSSSSTGALDVDVSQTLARRKVLETAERLKEEHGVILIEKRAKKELTAAVEELESVSEVPVGGREFVQTFLGDWTLVCTTSVNEEGIDTSKLPFLASGPIKELTDQVRKTVNRNVQVLQLIRSENNNNVVDRIDHVIEYQPPDILKDISLFQNANLPDQLSNINVNPLDVSKSKLILIHKASMVADSYAGVQTKLSLKSIVLNVAGTSTMLDPEGKDVFGLNLPLTEFQAGTFETVYMDDDMRVSRGRAAGDLVQQLRVFVRSGKYARDVALQDIRRRYQEGAVIEGRGPGATGVDVDEVQDPDFVSDDSYKEDEYDSLLPSDVSDGAL